MQTRSLHKSVVCVCVCLFQLLCLQSVSYTAKTSLKLICSPALHQPAVSSPNLFQRAQHIFLPAETMLAVLMRAFITSTGTGVECRGGWPGTSAPSG